jgi:ADP-ribose pyrophosphatase YjhB (NUDIX family)
MLAFRYCPLCAAHLAEIMLPEEGRSRLVCQGCGYIFYLNPRVVCGTLPIEEGRVWLLRRGFEPRLGYWTYPAGYQEIDESSEEAAVRETQEELGINVEVVSLHGVYSRPNAPVVNVVYAARLEPDSPRPGLSLEALEVHLFGPDEIPWGELAFPSTTLALRDWVERSGLPRGGTRHQPGAG